MDWQAWVRQSLPAPITCAGRDGWVKGASGLMGDALGPIMHSR